MNRSSRCWVRDILEDTGSASPAVRREGEMLVIQVRDQGPGIAADHLQQVAELFYRLERLRNRETGGAGLGLAIARAVAENHGGALTLENGVEGGLIACLSLRAAAQPD